MAREVCEILLTRSESDQMVQKVAGTFVLENGKLTSYPETPDNGLLFQRLLETKAIVDGGKLEIGATEQPALWFHKLPQMFTGTYLRARMVT